MGTIWKIKNSNFVENLGIWGYNFSMTVTHNENPTQKTSFWIPEHSQFFLQIKKLFLVGKCFDSST